MGIVQGKTVIVSGVGPGVGREIAASIVRDGGNAVIGARKAERLAAIGEALDPSGEHVAVCPTDILDADACARLVETAEQRFGAVDAVVHVAALDYVMGGIDDTSDADWEATLTTNVLGTMRLTKAAVPALRRAGGGSIVFIGSQQFAKPAVAVPQLAYGTSKGALFSAALNLAQQLGRDHIRVNTVVPTYMWGPNVEGYFTSAAEQHGITVEQATAPMRANMPLGEIPLDEDVAEAVTFFCSDRSRMITGQTLFVNAGELFW